MSKVNKTDATRIHRLTKETREAYDALMEAKDAFETKQNALVGALNIVAEEHPGFDPTEDAVSEDGEILKGEASNDQTQFVASDRQLRQIARQQRQARRLQKAQG